jgi:hypothetical protein
MTTDYGLHCERCNDAWITDNVREDDIHDIIADIHNFAKLYEVMDTLRFDVYLSTHFSTENSLHGLLKFAYLHHNHPLHGIDEYRYFDWMKSKICPECQYPDYDGVVCDNCGYPLNKEKK